MSEVEGAAGQEVTAGALLRAAREAAGLHVATLAANLKVPVRKLEALENDRYDELPDAVFIRALASSVCRTLKTDPQPVLDRLPQTPQVRLVQDRDGINTPFRAPGDGPKPGILDQVSRPVALTVLALLLAAGAVVFLPMPHLDDDAATSAPGTAPAPAAKAADPVMPPGSPPVTSAPSEPRPADPLAGASAPLTASTTLSQAPAPAAAPAAAPASPAAPAPAAAAASAPIGAVPSTAAASGPIRASGLVTFRTRGSSWIQVTDANGTPVFRRLMEAGETAGASGALPLAVTIGSVEQTEVLVRGKPYNLGPVSKDNVARFEVK